MSFAGLLDSLATVYTQGVGGGYTVSAKTNLAARLSTVSAKGATSAPDRAELAAVRQLFWDPSYTMPTYCQVEIGGVRWNVVPNTIAAPTKGGVVIYCSCDVVRAS